MGHPGGLDLMHGRHEGVGAGKTYGSQPQHVPQQRAEGSSSKEKHYFYESPSKYISLKKFSEELFQFSDMDSVKDPKDKKTKSQPSAQNKQASTEPSLHLSSSSSQQGYSLYSQHYLKQMKTQN